MRSIEEMQSSINNIREELQSLWHDLDDLRNEKNGGAFSFDIDELAVMAKHNPITPHPLWSKDKHTKRCYITLLLSVAQFEPDKLEECMQMAHAIAYGCGYIEEGNLLDEYTSSHMLTFTQIDEIVALFAHDDLRLMLVEEMLLMAGRFERGLKSAVEYISQICFLLKISADELTFLSQMSAVILSENVDLYKCGIENKYNLFDCYLKKIDFSNQRTKYTLKLPKYHKSFTSLRLKEATLRLEKKKLMIRAVYGDYYLDFEYDVSNRFVLLAKKISVTHPQSEVDKFRSILSGISSICDKQYKLFVGVFLHPLEYKPSVDMEKIKKDYGLHKDDIKILEE